MNQSNQYISLNELPEKWETLAKNIDDEIQNLTERMSQIRRSIHAHPEPSGEEFETTRFIINCFSGTSVEAKVVKDDIGVIADISIGKVTSKTPLIAIRADIDALRLNDEKNTSYKSTKPGLAHACGHDAHTAILLGIALACAKIKENNTELEVGIKLRFLFQPAEETCTGAKFMVGENVLKGVTAILALHIDPERQIGTAGIRYGALTANCDEIEILISGQGGHSARPHQTLDPIAAAAHLINSFYSFLPRAADSRNPSVFSIGKISGGTVANVIPSEVELRGSLRTVDNETREILIKQIENICQATEQNSNCKIKLNFLNPLPSVHNHPRIAHALETATEKFLGKENTHIIEQPSMGGEDFAIYLETVPGAMIRIGTHSDEIERTFLHSTHFDIDEQALAIGSRILLHAAILLSVELEGPQRPEAGYFDI